MACLVLLFFHTLGASVGALAFVQVFAKVRTVSFVPVVPVLGTLSPFQLQIEAPLRRKKV